MSNQMASLINPNKLMVSICTIFGNPPINKKLMVSTLTNATPKANINDAVSNEPIEGTIRLKGPTIG